MKQLIILLTILFVSLGLHAAPKNDLPQGRPFQILQSQIDNLQADMEGLIGRVTTLEQRMASVINVIEQLQAENQQLQIRISNNEDDIQSLQGQIDYNNNLLAMLQADLQQLQDELAMKQNMINGVCPDSQAVISIQPDGSLICASAGGSGSEVEVVTSFNWVCIPGYYGQSCDDETTATYYRGRNVTASCPAGYVASGGGYYKAADIELIDNRPYKTYGLNNSQWYLYGINRGSSGRTLSVYAVCLKQ